MNQCRARLTAVMTLILSLLAVFAASKGLLDKSLYQEALSTGTITQFLVTGSLAQDIISIPLGLILALLSISFLKSPQYKIFISLLGITGFFFYGYGLYTIQGQYTSLYLVYLVIFSLSLYSLILGLTSFEPQAVQRFQLPRALQKAISCLLLTVLVVLVPIWLSLLSGDIAKHLPGDTYGVFILDLGVVFPALGVIAGLLLRNKPFGNILAGVGLFKVLTVCLSVAFGEWFQAYYGGLPANYGMLAIFSTLTAGSLALLIGYLKKLSYERS